MCAFVCTCGQEHFWCVYTQAQRKTQFWQFFFFFFFSTSAPVPLRSPHRRLTLYAVTCDKPDGKAVFADIAVMTICLPLSKLCDKSQAKSNIWRGGSRRGEGNCVCVCSLNGGGSLSAAGERVRVYCSRTDQGIKFHTSMKGFTLLTNDIRGERHTKSTQDDSTSAARFASRHLLISVQDLGVLPLVPL